MKVLRDNKESLMAVLEAFVYDPLITWRLIQHDGDNRRAEREWFYHVVTLPIDIDIRASHES